MRFSPVRRAMVVGAVLTAFAVAGSVALAAIPTTGGTVYSCYHKTTGAMRAINYPTKHCTSNERMVALASATVMPKHVAGTFIGSVSDPAGTAMFRLEVDATATGALLDGSYEFSAMTGAGDWAGNQTQGTVDTVRFFTAASGAPGRGDHRLGVSPRRRSHLDRPGRHLCQLPRDRHRRCVEGIGRHVLRRTRRSHHGQRPDVLPVHLERRQGQHQDLVRLLSLVGSNSRGRR